MSVLIARADLSHCPGKLMGHIALGAALQPSVQFINDVICNKIPRIYE